jgi:hypothetical protein
MHSPGSCTHDYIAPEFELYGRKLVMNSYRNGRLLHDAASLDQLSDSKIAGRTLFDKFIRECCGDDVFKNAETVEEGNTRQIRPDADH